MEITQVKVFPVEEERLKAYVSIVLDDCFLVSDLKVIQGPNGVFVSASDDVPFQDQCLSMTSNAKANIKIIDGNNGLFVSMPSKRRKNGTFRDIAHPLNRETRERMEKKILSEYEKIRTEPTAPRIEDAGEEEPVQQEAAQ